MKLDMTPEEWEAQKERLRQYYLLMKSPDWTLEKQLKLGEEINKRIKVKN